MEKRKGLQAALEYVQQGKLDQAIAEYQAILRGDPNNPNVLNALGDLSARIGKKTEAIGHFRRLGEVYRVDGLYVRAIAVYKKVLKLDPAHFEASLACAEMYVEQGLTAEAKLQFQGVLDHFLRKGEVPGALEVCEKMMRLEPGQPAIIAKVAGILARPASPGHLLPKLKGIEERLVAAGQIQDLRQAYEKTAEMLSSQRRAADAAFFTDRLQLLDPAKAEAKVDEALAAVFPGVGERQDPASEAEEAGGLLEIFPGSADEGEQEEPALVLELSGDFHGVSERESAEVASPGEAHLAAPDVGGIPEDRLTPDETVELRVSATGEESATDDDAAPTTIELDPEASTEELDVLVGRSPEPVQRIAPQKLAEEMQEARFYLKQGMPHEARAILQRILRRDPEHTIARQLLMEIERVTEKAQEEKRPAPVKRESPLFRVADAKAPAGEFVDLAGEISEELEREETPLPAGLEPEVKRMLKELEQGIRSQLDVTDYETHYNLGIAYKDLELYDSAIGELRLATNDPTFRVRCASLMGLCFLAKGEADQAVEELLKGLAATQAGTEERWGVLYDLATAYEALGNGQKALEALLAIQNEMPRFRDVRARVRDIRTRLDAGGGASQ
jgi:tetratricopeptide (TPR) repeat protein